MKDLSEAEKLSKSQQFESAFRLMKGIIELEKEAISGSYTVFSMLESSRERLKKVFGE